MKNDDSEDDSDDCQRKRTIRGQTFNDYYSSFEYNAMMQIWDDVALNNRTREILKVCRWVRETKANADMLNVRLKSISEPLAKYARSLSVQEFLTVCERLPVCDKEFALMDEITDETIKSIKSYKRLFNVTNLTVPINRSLEHPFQYYRTN